MNSGNAVSAPAVFVDSPDQPGKLSVPDGTSRWPAADPCVITASGNFKNPAQGDYAVVGLLSLNESECF